MQLSRIIISNFRNFKSLDVELGQNAAVLGENKVERPICCLRCALSWTRLCQTRCAGCALTIFGMGCPDRSPWTTRLRFRSSSRDSIKAKTSSLCWPIILSNPTQWSPASPTVTSRLPASKRPREARPTTSSSFSAVAAPTTLWGTTSGAGCHLISFRHFGMTSPTSPVGRGLRCVRYSTGHPGQLTGRN
jgi:hypothetical protein